MLKLYFILLIFCMPMAGCEHKVQERVYEQVLIEAPTQNIPLMNDPHAGLGLKDSLNTSTSKIDHGLLWDVPKGWNEVSGSGIRVATFKNIEDPDAIDVSIITLSGEAGGLEANLIRWGNQIGIELQGDQQKLNAFIKKAENLKSKTGVPIAIFNFSQLQDQNPTSKSTVAAMLRISEATVFVKMTGTVQTLSENIESFKMLTQSLRQQ